MKTSCLVSSLVFAVILSGCSAVTPQSSGTLNDQSDESIDQMFPESGGKTGENRRKQNDDQLVEIGDISFRIPGDWQRVYTDDQYKQDNDKQIWNGAYGECFIMGMSESNYEEFTGEQGNKIEDKFHLREGSVSIENEGMLKMSFRSVIDQEDTIQSDNNLSVDAIYGSVVYGYIFKTNKKLYTMVFVANDNEYQKVVFEDIKDSVTTNYKTEDGRYFAFDKDWKVFTEQEECKSRLAQNELLKGLYDEKEQNSLCMYAGNGKEGKWVLIFEGNPERQPKFPEESDSSYGDETQNQNEYAWENDIKRQVYDGDKYTIHIVTSDTNETPENIRKEISQEEFLSDHQ